MTTLTKLPSLLLVFDVYVLSIDHAFVFLSLTVAAGVAAGSSTRRRTTRRRLRRLVHLFGQLVRRLGQGLASLLHGRLVVRLQGLLGVGHGVFYVAALRSGDFISVLAQHLFHVVEHAVELVLGVDRLACRFVFSRVRVGFFRHALDFVLRQSG